MGFRSLARNALGGVVKRQSRQQVRASLNHQAPEFSLADFSGKTVSLSDYRACKKRAARLQPRLHATVLPPAYGAVAP
jgi:hypothetical protein